MKHYRGVLTPTGGSLVTVENGGVRWDDLNPRFDLANHSPTGFAWGYGGSGPAQLALALLADALKDDERALDLYQRFKFRVIGRLDKHAPWTLKHQQIVEIAEEIERELEESQ